MSKSRLLANDPLTKVRRMFHASPDGETWGEESVQEVGGITDENKELYNLGQRRYGDMGRVAQIPIVVWEELMRQGIVSRDGSRILEPKKFKAWLNDSDNRAFRTRPGRV